tara:strand:+ start:13 stop:558 length:546 start_codon:yes stop_codon:yes gene_type:complete
MAEKSLDQFDKLRKNFNENFRRVTQAEIKQLKTSVVGGGNLSDPTTWEGKNTKRKNILKKYLEAVENENIIAVEKGKSHNNLFDKNIRLREFDSETYRPVKSFVKRGGVERRQERRSKANRDDTRMTGELSLGGSGYTKGYDTGLNMPVPTRRPRAAPKETLQQRNMGGKIHRGRKAIYNG